MAINLKKAELDNIPKLLEIEKSVAETKIYSAMLSENEWQHEIQNNTVYIIEKDSEAVGSVSYENKGENHVYISGLVIDPRFQNQGIARQVMDLVLEEHKDIKRIDLVTHPDNHPALKLYQSLGFIIESRQENYFGDGEPRLVLVLEK
ncbi:MAG: GNAT family N-acetyltransferase [bacterium]|nr:GNAT family N-acetyltransferase [bacterium]